MTYNRPETIYYKEAKRLLQSGMKLLSKVRISVSNIKSKFAQGHGLAEELISRLVLFRFFFLHCFMRTGLIFTNIT